MKITGRKQHLNIMSNSVKNTSDDKHFYLNIDWPLLFFIIAVVNVKTYIKAGAIFFYFIYLLFAKAKFPKKIPGLIKFYLFIPFVGIISPLFDHSFGQQGYLFGYAFGLMQWMVCAGAFYIIFFSVQTIEKTKLLKTIDAFFIINILVVTFQLIHVMVVSHSFMPYWLNDGGTIYGVSTGDYLNGVFGNNSLNTSSVCVMGGIYFLYNRKNTLACCSFIVMLLCTSNLSVFISLLMIFAIMVTKSGAIRKSALANLILLIVIYPLISLPNLTYMQTIYRKYALQTSTKNSIVNVGKHMATAIQSDSSARSDTSSTLLAGNAAKLKELKYLSDKDKAANSNLVLDQNQVRRSFVLLYGMPVEQSPLSRYQMPGKIYTLKQTAVLLKSSPLYLLFGAGTGNFSSKLAIKMTGLGLQGKYPKDWVYASDLFVRFHLNTMLYYLAQNISQHSVLNTPNSVYNQIAGEYGLIGLAIFVFFYLGYLWKNWRKLSYGKFLVVTLLLLFNVEYWFEMASLTVIFELLILIDIFVWEKNNEDQQTVNNNLNAGL